jgi:hypothetical protein
MNEIQELWSENTAGAYSSNPEIREAHLSGIIACANKIIGHIERTLLDHPELPWPRLEMLCDVLDAIETYTGQKVDERVWVDHDAS